MKGARSRVLGNERLVVKSHRSDGIHPTLPKQEREVVIGVDQNCSRPQEYRVAAKPAPRERGGAGGDRDVITDPHVTPPNRLGARRQGEGSPRRGTTRSSLVRPRRAPPNGRNRPAV